MLNVYCGRFCADTIWRDLSSGHNTDNQKLYDDERAKVLNGAGIKIIRFWNHDVLTFLESVLEEIYRHLVLKD